MRSFRTCLGCLGRTPVSSPVPIRLTGPAVSANAAVHPGLLDSIADCHPRSVGPSNRNGIREPPDTASRHSFLNAESSPWSQFTHYVVQCMHVQHRVTYGLRDLLAMIQK